MTGQTTPTWNCSTTCLQVLHHSMTEQGWDAWSPATPLRDYEFPRFDYELPQRPLDLGVGLWR